MSGRILLQALEFFPLVEAGDDLATLISSGLRRNAITPQHGDILVLAQKIVSKAEGLLVDLRSVTPGSRAMTLAAETSKDPRLVELILKESKSVIRQKAGVLITEHKRGWVMANAGIDASNVAPEDGREIVLLLPLDPDRSAADLRARLMSDFGCDIGIVISDSFGRPWRVGTTGVALGAAGLPSLWDRRGETDLFGRELQATQQAIGDELATAAALLQGQAAEGRPVVLVRGLDFSAHPSAQDRPAADLVRDAAEDLFR
jgi:coenzyme F420-0:L-glutamate ligase/coenzyme F420-1:gamma-L-glutamate ligase